MERKLSILYIGNKLSAHGRTPTSIETLGPLLEQEGHTVYYSSSKLNKFQRLKDMLKTIRQKKREVDVVLIDTYSTAAFHFAWVSGRLCRKLGLKYIPILHGGNLPERFKKSPAICKRYFGNSHANVVVSGYLHEHMKQEGYDSLLIGNNIVIEEYKYRHRTSLKAELIWVRAFHKTYNPYMAVELIDKLAKQYPDIHLTMVGPDIDGCLDVSKAFCAQKGLEKNITFTGKLSKKEWTQLAQKADVFINTTNYDNQPVSVIEAMALGLPVVSTNVGGIPYLVTHNKTGLLVNPDDTSAMAKAVKKLLKDEALTGKLSESGRKLAERYDWSIIKTKWQELFKTI